VALQKGTSIQVSEDLPQQVRDGPLLETDMQLPRRIHNCLQLFPPHDDLPLLRDAQSPEIVHRRKPMSPHHVDLLLLKDSPSKEKMQRSIMIFPLYVDPLQERGVLLLEIVL
jgi:hypothetical protein